MSLSCFGGHNNYQNKLESKPEFQINISEKTLLEI
jgi:hypothetical protein